MIPPEPPHRFVTPAARQKLGRVFGFPLDAYAQDWEFELADGQRLEEFIHTYDNVSLDDDEQFSLMALIVSSSEVALSSCGLTDGQWRTVHDRLVSAADLHASTIYYWCAVDATCDDECFMLTSRMRVVWDDAFASRAAMPEMPNDDEPSHAPEPEPAPGPGSVESSTPTSK